jgi:hypothetical protein
MFLFFIGFLLLSDLFGFLSVSLGLFLISDLLLLEFVGFCFGLKLLFMSILSLLLLFNN